MSGEAQTGVCSMKEVACMRGVALVEWMNGSHTSTVYPSVELCSAVLCSTVLENTMQCSIVLYSAVHGSVLQSD